MGEIRSIVGKITEEAGRQRLLVDAPSVQDIDRMWMACKGAMGVNEKTVGGKERNLERIKWTSIPRILREQKKRRGEDEPGRGRRGGRARCVDRRRPRRPRPGRA